MKGRTARRRAIWAWNLREARNRPHTLALPCVLREYDRLVRENRRKVKQP